MGDARADVGVVGLAVMGQNLALNMADHGFAVGVYNRTASKMESFVEGHPPGSVGEGDGRLIGCADLEGLVAAVGRPRRILLMVKAGGPTDSVIDELAPLLSRGDCIIDGGNAHWEDTIRRERALGERGLLFVGSGVSGGEEGARFGPSLMPGGTREAWALIEPVWTAIAAKVDPATGKPIEGAEPGRPVRGGEACAAHVGPDGAGHYVKMVHNGIEYADMQMICEAFHLVRGMGGLEPAAVADVFSRWNEGDLDSFLIEITADILRQKDPETGRPFVDVVLDAAGQKGTGKWTSQNAMDFGVPAPTIGEAVFARFMSALKEQRVEASGRLAGPGMVEAARIRDEVFGSTDRFVDAIERALYCAKICSYAQGFGLMAAASRRYEWGLNLGEIAKIWRGGCIIRARFLQRITGAYEREAGLKNLLLDPNISRTLEESQEAWRGVVAAGMRSGVPLPAFSSALSYYAGYRHAVLPAKLLQAQRDYFGAHTYERVDMPRGRFFHLDWPNPDRPQEAV